MLYWLSVVRPCTHLSPFVPAWVASAVLRSLALLRRLTAYHRALFPGVALFACQGTRGLLGATCDAVQLSPESRRNVLPRRRLLKRVKLFRGRGCQLHVRERTTARPPCLGLYPRVAGFRQLRVIALTRPEGHPRSLCRDPPDPLELGNRKAQQLYVVSGLGSGGLRQHARSVCTVRAIFCQVTAENDNTAEQLCFSEEPCATARHSFAAKCERQCAPRHRRSSHETTLCRKVQGSTLLRNSLRTLAGSTVRTPGDHDTKVMLNKATLQQSRTVTMQQTTGKSSTLTRLE